MRKLLLFTLLISTSAFSSMEEIKKNWIFTKLYTQEKNGTIRGNKLFKRMVIVKNYAWPVATMTFTRQLGLKEKVNLKKVKNDFVSTFDTTKFTIKKSKDTYNLEGIWKEGNRFLSVQFQKLNRFGFAMTVTTARLPYLDSTYPEIKELERKLRSEIVQMVKGPFKKTSYFPFISPAHAQPTLPDIGDLLPNPNPLASGRKYIFCNSQIFSLQFSNGEKPPPPIILPFSSITK